MKPSDSMDVVDCGQANPSIGNLQGDMPGIFANLPAPATDDLHSAKMEFISSPITPTPRGRAPVHSADVKLAEAAPVVKVAELEYFEHSTDYLVREFLKHRLCKSGQSNAAKLLSESVKNLNEPHSNSKTVYSMTSLPLLGYSTPVSFKRTWKRFDKTLEALKDLGDHFDARYAEAFQDVFPGNWLDLEDVEDVKNKFFGVLRDLRGNGNDREPAARNEPGTISTIKWGRIVAHFCFTSQLVCAAANSNQDELVVALASWLTQFITRYLKKWIEQNGGWEGLVVYQEALSLQKTWAYSTSNIMCGVGAGLLLGMLGFAVVKKYIALGS